jgi:fibronectin-binding autotransporter adhesin
MNRKLQSGGRRKNGLRSRSGHLIVMAAAASALFVRAGSASAAATYTGGGTVTSPVTGDWNTSGNWSPAGIPASSTTTELDFLGSSSTYVSTDDIPGVFQLNILKLNSLNATIAAGSGDSLSLTGTSPIINQIGAGTATVSAPVALSAATAIQQVSGGAINFTGPITTSNSSGLTLTNASGSGNSTVSFTGANTFSGLQINSNVTAIAGLSSNTTTLGSGTVTLNGGELALQGQQSASGAAVQLPIGVTGFNADTIMDAAGTTNGPDSSTGTPLSDVDAAGAVHNSHLFYVNGYANGSGAHEVVGGYQAGLPSSGSFTSATTNTYTGGHTTFDFAYNGTSINYAANNTLYFTSTGTGETLTLANPTAAASLDFLATAQNTSTFNIQINFTTGAPTIYSSSPITTGPWAFGTAPSNVALTNASGSVVEFTNGSNFVNTGYNWRFTENDIALSPTDQSRTISSITFTPTSLGGGNTAEIYAVSGQVFSAPQLLSSQSYANNVSVTANSDIDVSGSLAATMGTLSIGSSMLSVTSADATTSTYSLTLGPASFSGNPTFNVASSSGGGAGTLNLGAITDGGTARTITINPTGTDAVTLASAASSLVAGTVINIEGGTLNSNIAGAIGTTASVDISGTGTFNVGASQQISALNGTTGTVTLGTNTLSVGSTDNLSSSYGGLITGAGTVIAQGTGNVTLSGANTYSGTSVSSNGAHIQTSLQINNGAVVINGPTVGTSGAITSDPAGTAAIIVSPPTNAGTPINTSLLLGNTPGLSLPNPITIASGNNGNPILGGLNTTGVTTFSGNVTLGTGSSGDYGHNLTVGATGNGEVDFTGNIVANGASTHSAVTVNNLSGSGSATVSFTGNNSYAGGTVVNPNVTLVAGLSTSMNTLGAANTTVNLAGGNLALKGQLPTGSQVTVSTSGFNADTILDNAATTGTASSTGTPTSPIDGNSLYYESGYLGSAASTGLPTGGAVTSASTGHAFQLTTDANGHYTIDNTLQFTAPSATVGQTLTLATPTQFQSLDFLTSGQGTDTFKVVLTFSDTSTDTLGSFTTQDWYGGNAATNAVTGLNSVVYSGPNSGNINAYGAYTLQENDLTLSPTDESKTVSSITFIPTALGGSTSEVYAISGATYAAPIPLSTQTYSNNLEVSASSAINVSGSLAAVMGSLGMGGSTLSVGSTDATTNAYSLTFGYTQFQGTTADFNVSNSAGGGAGTLVLGTLDDQGAVQVITKSGSGALTLSADATSLVNGTIFDVTAGTLNSNSANATGGLAAINVASGATFSIGTSQIIGSLGDYMGPVVNGATVALNGNTLTVGTYTDQSSTYSGKIIDGTGSGSLYKGGLGTFTLVGSSTYSGTTTVGLGTLLVMNTSGSATGTSSVSVAATNQAFLSGIGTISGPVSVAVGGNIFAGTETDTPGETAGTLHIGTGSVLTGNALLDVTGVDTSDEIIIGGGTGSVTLGGVLTVGDPNSTAYAIGQDYTILQFGSATGTFGTLNLPTLASGLAWDTSHLYTSGPSGGYIDVVAAGPTSLVWDNHLSSTGDGKTWDNGSGGISQNWNASGTASSFIQGAAVVFNDSNNGNYTVNLAANVLPSSVTVASAGSYVFESTGGFDIKDYTSPTTLTQSGGGTLTIENPNTFTGATSVSGSGTFLHLASTGTLATSQLTVAAESSAQIDGLLTNNPAVIANGNVTFGAAVVPNNDPSGGLLARSLGSLTIGSGATVALASGSPSTATVLTLGSLSDSGTFDISDNRVYIDYGSGPDPIASIAAWIKNGYYGLSGPSIISTAIASADAATGLLYGIGYADGADGEVAGLPSGEIEITFTLLGDANLDGTVNAEDYTPFSHNIGQSGMYWDDGDFNYDGTVNAEDYTDFSHNIGQSAALAPQAGVLEAANGISLSNVPEPASAGLMVMAGLGMLRRRRRSS